MQDLTVNHWESPEESWAADSQVVALVAAPTEPPVKPQRHCGACLLSWKADQP